MWDICRKDQSIKAFYSFQSLKVPHAYISVKNIYYQIVINVVVVVVNAAVFIAVAAFVVVKTTLFKLS
jgi:hypothetical protein